MGATYLLVGNFDTYQLIINTPTTIITFLLVALLQNTHKRNEQALQHKLDAVADDLGDLMEHFAEDDPGRPRRIWRATSRTQGPRGASKERCEAGVPSWVPIRPQSGQRGLHPQPLTHIRVTREGAQRP